MNQQPTVAIAPFPIVGIGASAGGLAAFEAFFSGMPAERDPGMACMVRPVSLMPTGFLTGRSRVFRSL